MDEKRAFIQTAALQFACCVEKTGNYNAQMYYEYMTPEACVNRAKILWDTLYPEEATNVQVTKDNENGIKEEGSRSPRDLRSPGHANDF